MKDTNAEKSRLQWVDLFRGVAVLWMIETHTANTFLRPEILKADWFKWLNYTNGLVAPAFLFIAGVLHGKARKAPPAWFSVAGFKGVGGKLLRIGQLLFIGYALHFQVPADGNWAKAFSHIDILQCMGVAMAMGLFLKEAGRGAIGLAAVFFFIAAPWMSQVPSESMPALVAGYVNRQNGSLFPLFPWAGFFFAGWFCQGFTIRQCLMAAGICWGAVWGQQFLPTLLPAHDYFLAGPGFFLERLGWMFMGVAGCQWAMAPRDLSGPAALGGQAADTAASATSLILRAGRSSLAIYVIHLVLISQVGGWAVAWGVPVSVGMPLMIALFLANAALSLTLAGLPGLRRGAPAYHWLGGRRASASAPLP